MKPQARISFACLVSLIIIPHILCDEVSDASKVNKVACMCSQNQSIAHDSKCSTSCNCSPGSSSQVNSSKIWIFSESTVIILLIFGLIMTLAFIVLLVWYKYTYRRNRFPVQESFFSPDKDTCIYSSTKFVSNRDSSATEYKVYTDSSSKQISGRIHKALFLFKNKKETIPGTLERFSYPELVDATEKFSASNLIGVGGSSHVYCGHLRCGKTVAIKRLKNRGRPDIETIFLTEIAMISRLHHSHVVPLLGYCLENQGKQVERMLVFEYMHNGNLRECLDGKLLDWSRRVAIALGVAKGLEYLHEAAAPKILHRDIKSTNVLLDEKFRAKITDLGTAKHLSVDDLPSCLSSPDIMQGTFGYFAPEYAITGRASLKSDVFSFGVVLLELISGRLPINQNADKGVESIVIWATPRLWDSKRVITELPDPNLNGKFPEKEMQLVAYLAKECLLVDPDSRPSMSEAVQILSTISPYRRRNISISLFQSSFHSNARHGDVAEKHVKTEVFKEVMSTGLLSNRFSLPLHIDRTLCAENNEKEVDTISRHIDRLLLLTKRVSHLHSQEDEVVDITEPRFESFFMEYVRCSV